jgi:hypothetical protein
MLNDSNYYVLSRYKLPRRELCKRLQYLENSITQLKAYHGKAHRHKIVSLLIVQYEDLRDKINKRLEM